ncbi:MAG: GNAT family N-acetyltransferase [Planctomycetes bacterium]|jgi:ribosomal protein S18 acetylase RimI-like enzyme|nr:GNAT family N-acetyltransferase [Planctomycetota bacterium]
MPEEQEQSAVEIRPARSEDMDALLGIERQCFNVYFYDYYMLDRRQFECYLQDPECIFLVAVHTGRVVGDILGPVETWRDPPKAHIDSIGVLPEVQHQGIGTRLLRAFLNEVRRYGCTRVTLEVSTANATGLAFFMKHSFRKTRLLPDYYGRGLPGQLMTVELTSPYRAS